MEFNECSLKEWLSAFQKAESSARASQVQLFQNIFSSLQWIGFDAVSNSQRKAYSVRVEGRARAWLMCYQISQDTARLRGLYVEPEYRRQGLMSFLLKNVEQEWVGKTNKLISFSTKEGLGFHRSMGFQVEKDFIPRPVEHFDHLTGQYYSSPDSELTLMSKLLK